MYVWAKDMALLAVPVFLYYILRELEKIHSALKDLLARTPRQTTYL